MSWSTAITTIAYRSGILASDSRLTIDDHITSDKCKKIFRLHDGSLFGWSGDNEGGILLLRALEGGDEFPKKMPDRASDVAAIRVMPRGQIFVTEGLVWQRWHEPFASVGSGSRYARAAMLAGATAQQAVKIAIASDANSGGRVQVLRLKR